MIGAARVLPPERAGNGAGDLRSAMYGTGEAWVQTRLAGFARLPGGFAARGDLKGRCEDALAFRMPQARSIKPESEALLRPVGSAPKPHLALSTKHQPLPSASTPQCMHLKLLRKMRPRIRRHTFRKGQCHFHAFQSHQGNHAIWHFLPGNSRCTTLHFKIRMVSLFRNHRKQSRNHVHPPAQLALGARHVQCFVGVENRHAKSTARDGWPNGQHIIGSQYFGGTVGRVHIHAVD